MIKFINEEAFTVNMERELKRGITSAEQAMERTMAEAEIEAKTHAPWTDRTGNARNSITGVSLGRQGKEVVGALYIGVYYGIFLELCNQGRYRVVWPTLEGAVPRLNYWLKQAFK